NGAASRRSRMERRHGGHEWSGVTEVTNEGDIESRFSFTPVMSYFRVWSTPG
ncbi:hypothetical protein Bpfe_026775, partial [Biomphalaria pfeifferi]